MVLPGGEPQVTRLGSIYGHIDRSGWDDLLVDGFRQVSKILDERKSTLAADPVLVELADRVAAAPDPESDEVKGALPYAVDSRERSGAAEAVQYFAHRFR
ncbi:hypothetical protein [Streptomyces pseudovenezuelae]|uniref:hypothetical protein n=1 Tax=Streptomyces pseudovenezuelae TaxID=67350 RepID=UPI0037233FA3